jgi:hypothetical protein
MKRVIVYENRKTDGPILWDISTPELEKGAFLDLFKYLDESWQIYYGLTDLQEPTKPSLTLEQIEGLPEGRVREEAMAEQKDYKHELSYLQESRLQQKLYERSKSGDANAAKRLLSMRQDHEYESWTICDVVSKEI